MTRARDLTRAGLAALVLAAAVIGAPLALWRLAVELDLHPPAGGRWIDALTRPDDGSLLLTALLATGWVCWAAFTLATVTEAVAAVRGLPAPRLPGLAAPQRAAASLIAAVALLAPATAQPAGTTPTSSPPPVTSSTTVTHPATVVDLTSRRTADLVTAPRHTPPAHRAVAEGPLPVITVHRHDTLWRLAETHLGAGERWTEIYRLNRDRPQPDGCALHDPDWIYPGWQLRLPRDARAVPHPHRSADLVEQREPRAGSGDENRRPRRHPEADAHRAERHYLVKTGDTLWDIAATQLGDPTLWRDLYRINKDRPQPDGQSLTDPRLILPGWRLRIPDSHHPKTRSKEAPKVRHADPAHPSKTTTPTPLAPSPTESAPSAVVPPPVGEEPPPAADGPTAAPSTPAPATTESSPAYVTVDDDPPITESALLPLLGLGLGAATLTGLVAEIARRRRRQQSSRRAGQRIPMPEPNAAGRETTARMHAIPGTIDAITAALRAVAAGCRGDRRPLPNLLLIHASADGIRLQLTEPDRDAIAPFTATDDGSWLLTQDPTQLSTTDTDPFPALVCVGVAGDAMLLLNLEAAGTLTLTGDTGRVEAALRAYAVDLVVGPLSGAATLTLTGPALGPLATALDPCRSHTAHPDQAVRELTNHADALTAILDGITLRTARAERGVDDTTRPAVLVSAGHLTVQPHAWSGAALIQPGPNDDGPWRLDIPAEGLAVLQPLGLHLDAQQLSDDHYQAVVELLATADIEPGHQHIETDTPETARLRVSQALPPTPDLRRPASPPDAQPTDAAPRVLLLGPLQITGVRDDRAPHRTRRLTELVTYLALHPDATAHQIDEALWPGKRIAAASRNSSVSRTRQWLGHDPDGDPYLPLVGEGGRLTLAKSVTCDWYDFLRHTRSGLDQVDPDELTAALDLVRGRPFQGIDDHRYTWAETDIQQMISTIVDVACLLAQSWQRAGNHRMALQTALKGLEVDGLAEPLLQLALDAARTLGDDGQQRRLQVRLDNADDDWPEPPNS